MALLASAVFEHVGAKVDQAKVLKMIALHDLAEAITGDIPAFAADKRDGKYEKERSAMQQLTSNLPRATATEFMALWEEMEAKETPEALLAQSMDKLEVLLQHIIADISTWDDGDYSLGPYNKDEYFDFDPFIRTFKDEVNEMFWRKMEAHDKLDRLKPEHLSRRKAEKKP
jgi:putative hydrolase of HD superfamily